MSPEERAREWLEGREIEDHIQAHESHAASLAQLLQDYGDQRAREAREEALRDAEAVCLDHADRLTLRQADPDSEAHPRLKSIQWGHEDAAHDLAEAIRSLAHKERPR
jgi:hypothetical protein